MPALELLLIPDFDEWAGGQTRNVFNVPTDSLHFATLSYMPFFASNLPRGECMKKMCEYLGEVFSTYFAFV